MTAPNPRPLVETLHRRPVSRPPFWFMRQAGRYLPEYRATRAKARDFIELCFTPELATEITLQPVRRFGMDAAILFADILLLPHALGRTVVFREGEGPVFDRLDGDDTRAVAAMAAQRAEALAMLAPVAETVRRVRAALPASTALIGFAGAPWTVASYVVEGRGGGEFVRARRAAATTAPGFGALIDLLIETTVEYLSMQIAAGADAVMLFDSWAGLLPADEFRRWCLAPTVALVQALKRRHPEVPVIGFARGAGASTADFAREAGVDGVSLDQMVPLGWAARELAPHAVLQGNLDPLLLAIGGAPMMAAARRILAAWGGGPMVFNLGHGVTPDVPVAHVERLSALLRGEAPAGDAG